MLASGIGMDERLQDGTDQGNISSDGCLEISLVRCWGLATCARRRDEECREVAPLLEGLLKYYSPVISLNLEVTTQGLRIRS